MKRPECFEFAMDFLGDPEAAAVRAYVEQLEGAMTDARKVVCAAIRAVDGAVVLGIRHYSADMWDQINARKDGDKFLRRHGDDQGFVDQHSTYLTREEAQIVAAAAGQVPSCAEPRQLYSEDLY